jgi:hypothetical protein
MLVAVNAHGFVIMHQKPFVNYMAGHGLDAKERIITEETKAFSELNR